MGTYAMEIDFDYGEPVRQNGLDVIDSTTMCQQIHREIGEQVQSVRRRRLPNDPLLCELLVPADLAKSTFQLPAVQKLLRDFLPLEDAVNGLLAPQVNWAPPGYKPSDSDVKRAGARLWAIRTDGDGDCLLHAVSLSLWGQHDRTVVLRLLVVEILCDRISEKILFRSWREGQQRADAAAGGNASFRMEEDQVIAEWHMLVQAAKTPSAYLSSFHAFILANALRRPILVYGDRFVRGKDGEPYAPSDVRGVYLPTLVESSLCYKVPIAVGYTCVAVGKVGHFTALVGVHGELHYLPLVDEHGNDLPVRYGVSPASATKPNPAGDAMEEYMATTPYPTVEGKKYRMAIVRDTCMTPEAEKVRRAMGRAAGEAFDRLAKAQEEEIKQQLGTVPDGTNASPSDGRNTTTAQQNTTTNPGRGDHRKSSPPPPPSPSLPSATVVADANLPKLPSASVNGRSGISSSSGISGISSSNGISRRDSDHNGTRDSEREGSSLCGHPLPLPPPPTSSADNAIGGKFEKSSGRADSVSGGYGNGLTEREAEGRRKERDVQEEDRSTKARNRSLGNGVVAENGDSIRKGSPIVADGRNSACNGSLKCNGAGGDGDEERGVNFAISSSGSSSSSRSRNGHIASAVGSAGGGRGAPLRNAAKGEDGRSDLNGRIPTASTKKETVDREEDGKQEGRPGHGEGKRNVGGSGDGTVVSPPQAGRFLSAPLGVLSAVGAWATGRSRTAPTAAAADGSPNAPDEDTSGGGAATDGRDRTASGNASISNGKLSGNGRRERDDKWSSIERRLPVECKTSGTGAGIGVWDSWRDEIPGVNGAVSRSATEQLALKLDVPHQDPRATSTATVAAAAAAAATDRYDDARDGALSNRDRQEVDHIADDHRNDRGGFVARGANGDVDSLGASSRNGANDDVLGIGKGKRKPESSPAVTPEGLSPARQHFGDTADEARALSRGAWDEARNTTRSDRPEGMSGEGARSSLSRRPAKSTAVRRLDESPTTLRAAASTTAAAAAGDDEHVANGAREMVAAANDAAWARAYHATDRWRAARAGGDGDANSVAAGGNIATAESDIAARVGEGGARAIAGARSRQVHAGVGRARDGAPAGADPWPATSSRSTALREQASRRPSHLPMKTGGVEREENHVLDREWYVSMAGRAVGKQGASGTTRDAGVNSHVRRQSNDAFMYRDTEGRVTSFGSVTSQRDSGKAGHDDIDNDDDVDGGSGSGNGSLGNKSGLRGVRYHSRAPLRKASSVMATARDEAFPDDGRVRERIDSLSLTYAGGRRDSSIDDVERQRDGTAVAASIPLSSDPYGLTSRRNLESGGRAAVAAAGVRASSRASTANSTLSTVERDVMVGPSNGDSSASSKRWATAGGRDRAGTTRAANIRVSDRNSSYRPSSTSALIDRARTGNPSGTSLARSNGSMGTRGYGMSTARTYDVGGQTQGIWESRRSSLRGRAYSSSSFDRDFDDAEEDSFGMAAVPRAISTRGQQLAAAGAAVKVSGNGSSSRASRMDEIVWREKEIARLSRARQTPLSPPPRPTPSPLVSWKSEALRRKVDIPASQGYANTGSSPSRRSSVSSVSSSSFSANRLRPSSNVPGAVAREFSSRGAGAMAGGAVGTASPSSSSAYRQTLSSLRRLRAAESRRAMGAGHQPRKTFSDTPKFY